jgi:hypothetical protein
VSQWHVAAGLISGQVKKSSRRRKLMRVTHVMRLGTEAALTAALQGLGFSGRLNTAFIERAPLTVRHGVAALARRPWAKAQPAPYLLAHLQWWRASSHFVRPHHSLRVALVSPRERGASCWPHALGSERRLWQPAEPIDDGRHASCSLAPCRPFPLERQASLMWEECHVASKSGKVPAEALGCRLTSG